MKFVGRSIMVMMSLSSVMMCSAEMKSQPNGTNQAIVAKQTASQASDDDRGVIRRTWDSAVGVVDGAWTTVKEWFGIGSNNPSSKSQKS